MAIRFLGQLGQGKALEEHPGRFLRIFLLCLLLTGLASFTLTQGLGVFRCHPEKVAGGVFTAYCTHKFFGDYEHGAYFFDLEPEAVAAMRQARILFLGNSRAQFAFSTRAVAAAMAEIGASYHLAGFGYASNDLFARALFAQHPPAAKLMVVNADPFFDREMHPDVARVVGGGELTRAAHLVKKWAYRLHDRLCLMPGHWQDAFLVCQGKKSIIYRDLRSGAWIPTGTFLEQANLMPVVERMGPASPKRLRLLTERARAFLEQVGMTPECLVLVTVPSGDKKKSALESAAVAERIGARFLWPEVAGLSTFDKSHLDRESAERWSGALMRELIPVARKCLAPSPGALP